MPQFTIPNFDKVSLAPPVIDPGKYTVNIQETPVMETADPKEGESVGKTYLQVVMKVTDGPNQSEPDPATGSFEAKGRTIKDRLYQTPNAYWRVKAILIAAGILKRDDVDSPLAKGNVNSDILMGTHFQINVTANGKYRNVEYIV